jgi:hypothetical protein
MNWNDYPKDFNANRTSSKLLVFISVKKDFKNNLNFFRLEQNGSVCSNVALSDVLEALWYSGTEPYRKAKQAETVVGACSSDLCGDQWRLLNLVTALISSCIGQFSVVILRNYLR